MELPGSGRVTLHRRPPTLPDPGNRAATRALLPGAAPTRRSCIQRRYYFYFFCKGQRLPKVKALERTGTRREVRRSVGVGGGGGGSDSRPEKRKEKCPAPPPVLPSPPSLFPGLTQSRKCTFLKEEVLKQLSLDKSERERKKKKIPSLT